MSAFSGRAFKGAMREHRKEKRTEAEARNARPNVLIQRCGHVTTLNAAEHVARCGAMA